MTEKLDEIYRQLQQQLRARAEAQLAGGEPEIRSGPIPDAVGLLHELHVHQIELEMQNEELRRAQVALDASRSRYVDLYDFAPVGYLTLNNEGMVTEINLTGAKLLGLERKQIIGQRFERFIENGHKDRWYRHCLLVKTEAGKQGCELPLCRSDGSGLYVQVDSQYSYTGGAESELRLVLADITGQAQAREALAESEDRLNFAFLGSGDGMWDWNVATGEVNYSTQWKAMLGYSEDELKSDFKEWEGRVHPDDLEAAMAGIQGYLRGATPAYANEHRLRCKDGSYKWILTRGTALTRGPDGSPVRMIGTHTDITKHRHTEELLRIAAAAFETQDGIIVTDANKIILRVNNAFCRITSYSPEEVVNRDTSFLRSGVHPNEFYQAVLESINSTGYWQGEMWGKRKDGGVFPTFHTITAVYGEDKAISHYVGSFKDITKRKQTDDAQRVAAAAFETQAGIIVTDADKIILRVNSAFNRLTGYGTAEAANQTLDFLRSGRHDVDFYSGLWASVIAKGYWQGEAWMKRKDGGIFPVLINIAAVIDPSGCISHFVGSFTDITLQKQAEQRLNDAHDQMENTVVATQVEMEQHKQESAGANTALGVVLKLQGAEQTEAKIALSNELEITILPFLDKLKQTTKGQAQSLSLIDILEGNLKHLVNTYGDVGNLPAAYRQLTPVECQVASMVRQGLSTKAIAKALSIVPETVSTHRKHIRQKLGLGSKGTNLQSYLISLAER